jgi:hypothetical protein
MLTLIGSHAARRHFSDFREPHDVDFHTADADEAENFKQKYRDAGKRPPDVFVDQRLEEWPYWGPFATPEELYTMKVSHAFWEINRDPNNWNKHMSDVIFFQRKGVDFNRELYNILRPIWKDLHAPHRTSLAQNKKNFFNDAVKRIYDHDSIHASIAYGDHPLYEDILVPGEEVMVDNDRFFNDMDLETQLKCVREEVYATALERILIPRDYSGSPGAAYAWALRRTITSLFKGEWALWTVLHYDTLARPDCNYLQRHLDNKDKLIPLEEK